MWKRSLLGTGLAATVLAASPSLATTAATWTVKPGGNFSGSSSSVTFKDTSIGVAITCSSSSISGKLKSGSGLSGTQVASITAFSFAPNSCVGPLGLQYTWTFGFDFPYSLNANSYDTASGQTSAHVTGLVGALSGSGCALTLWGTTDTTPGKVQSQYINSTHKLKLIASGSTLHAYRVSAGCTPVGILWNDGDPVTISGTYAITPAQTITSP